MNFIEPDVVLISEKDPCKKIELAGRTCYKSEDKITKTSAKKFVSGIIKRNHTAMMEHVCFVFQIDENSPFSEKYFNVLREYKYLNTTKHVDYTNENGVVRSRVRYLVSGSIRAICERNVVDPIYKELLSKYKDLAFGNQTKEIYGSVGVKIVELKDFTDLTEEEILKHSYFTFRVTCDRGVTHEIVRHRPCSFAQESTRYVNYENGILIAKPTGFDNKDEKVKNIYTEAFECAEKCYRELIESGETPQQARAVLPTALKTEIVWTANMEEWKHVLNLRYFGTTGKPHPDMEAIAEKIYRILKKDKLVGGLLE